MVGEKVLVVRGLHDTVTQDVLLSAFSVFGEVVSVDIPIDSSTQKGRGFGYVEFIEPEDARDALDNMHESELYGRTIYVKLSNKQAPTQISDPKRAVWADELYHRKLAQRPIGDGELTE